MTDDIKGLVAELREQADSEALAYQKSIPIQASLDLAELLSRAADALDRLSAWDSEYTRTAPQVMWERIRELERYVELTRGVTAIAPPPEQSQDGEKA